MQFILHTVRKTCNSLAVTIIWLLFRLDQAAYGVLHTVRKTCNSLAVTIIWLLFRLDQAAYGGVNTLVQKGVNHLDFANNSPVLPVFVKQHDHVKALRDE